MGQRGFSATPQSCRSGVCSRGASAAVPPADPVEVEARPIAPAALDRSWLPAVEAGLVREWLAGRRRQRRGVLATSPHVSLACAAAPFPANRTSALMHADSGEEAVTEVPVGKEFFKALRTEWTRPAENYTIQPPTADDDLNSLYVSDYIEGNVGLVMSPGVPLSFMVERVLAVQWAAEQ